MVLVFSWYGVGVQLVYCWCSAGTVLVFSWFDVGVQLVWCWCSVGKVLVFGLHGMAKF